MPIVTDRGTDRRRAILTALCVASRGKIAIGLYIKENVVSETYIAQSKWVKGVNKYKLR